MSNESGNELFFQIYRKFLQVYGDESMQNLVKNTIEKEATHNVNVLKCGDKN